MTLLRGVVASAICVSTMALTIAYSRLAPQATAPAAVNAHLPAECYRSLSSRTGSFSNRTYANALAEARQNGQSGRCFIASRGRCGDLHFVSIGNGFVLETEYFAGERLIAARAFTDDRSENQECPGWTHYGQRLTCDDQVLESYCERPPLELGGPVEAAP